MNSTDSDHHQPDHHHPTRPRAGFFTSVITNGTVRNRPPYRPGNRPACRGTQGRGTQSVRTEIEVSAERLATSVSARSDHQNRRGAGDQNRRTVGFALAKSAAIGASIGENIGHPRAPHRARPPIPRGRTSAGISRAVSSKIARGDHSAKLRRTMPPARTSKNRGHALLALDADKWHAPCLCWRHAAMQHGHRADDSDTRWLPAWP